MPLEKLLEDADRFRSTITPHLRTIIRRMRRQSQGRAPELNTACDDRSRSNMSESGCTERSGDGLDAAARRLCEAMIVRRRRRAATVFPVQDTLQVASHA
jgi:hypothetical protein